ncbi:MAG: precorrin-2 C(20)-methyltransferase [Oscillospiraceae bacterium]|nr:precorrin-2 C(20)-methyltransferase [Oscillospiraceae bacterium]
MRGKLYGVGVGPGDPELMTLKAVRVLKQCPIIGIPNKSVEVCTAWQIAIQAVPEMADKKLIAVPVPMTKDRAKLDAAYDAGSAEIAAALEAGEDVAFLNLGDPTLYGSYMEVHKRIAARGFDIEIISAVPSICAVAAALGEPLGEREEAIHILPGNYGAEGFASLDGVKVLMKPASRLGVLKEQLGAEEAAGRCRVMAVSNCGMPDQQIHRGAAALDTGAGYFVTILVKDTPED